MTLMITSINYNLENIRKVRILPPVDYDPPQDLDADKVQVGIVHEHAQQWLLVTTISWPPSVLGVQLQTSKYS